MVDGEVFAQHIEHNSRFRKQNKLPYIQQLIEPDYLPNISRGDNVIAGIEFDDWLNPLNYYFSRTTGNVLTMNNLIQIDADKVIHLALKRKINQVRGISKMAPVLNTITDLADYENSERVAAKIAASLVGFIKKEMPEDWTLEDYEEADELLKEESGRMLEVAPGMFAHDLGIGEDIGLIQSNRSATYLSEFSKHMVRSIASGTNSSYSTISNDYNGTYSAQRQELLEQWQHYKVLQNEFGCQYLQPTFMRFVQCCIEAGLIKVPRGVWLIDNAQYLAPVMPWIDPYTYLSAEEAVAKGFCNEILNKKPDKSQENSLREQMRAYPNQQMQAVINRLFSAPNSEPLNKPTFNNPVNQEGIMPKPNDTQTATNTINSADLEAQAIAKYEEAQNKRKADITAIFNGKHEDLMNTCLLDSKCTIENAKDKLLDRALNEPTPSNSVSIGAVAKGQFKDEMDNKIDGIKAFWDKFFVETVIEVNSKKYKADGLFTGVNLQSDQYEWCIAVREVNHGRKNNRA